MWVKLDDRFAGHPKIRKAGPEAGFMFVAALCHAASYLTDGFIAAEEVAGLARVKDPMKTAQKLVDVGLWLVVDGGFQVHEYLEHHPSKDQRLAELERERERKRVYLAKKNAEPIEEKTPPQAQLPPGSTADSERNPTSTGTGLDGTGQVIEMDRAREGTASGANSVVRAALELFVDRAVASTTTPVKSPDAFRRTVRERITSELAPGLTELAASEKVTDPRRLFELYCRREADRKERDAARTLARNWATTFPDADEMREELSTKFKNSPRAIEAGMDEHRKALAELATLKGG